MPSIDDAFPSRYLRATDLKGRRTRATIESVSLESIGRGREAQKKLVMEFAEPALKALICNKTNAVKIAALAGTKQYSEWSGFAITLVPTTTMFGSDEVDCIRIDNATEPAKATRKPVPPAAREGSPDLETLSDPTEEDWGIGNA